MNRLLYRLFLVATGAYSLVCLFYLYTTPLALTSPLRLTGIIVGFYCLPVAIVGLWFYRLWGVFVVAAGAGITFVSAIHKGTLNALTLAGIHGIVIMVVVVRILYERLIERILVDVRKSLAARRRTPPVRTSEKNDD